jgi:hypothetical protein
LTEFDQELATSRPVFVLLDLGTLPEGAKADGLPITLPQAASPALVRLVSHLNRSYSIRRRWRDKLLLKRNDGAAARASEPRSQSAAETAQ